jgi:hypothetical protein
MRIRSLTLIQIRVHDPVFTLKVMTINKKRGGLNLVSFDWSRCKLFTLKFSKESVQIPSCERPKTAQRTLFMSFDFNTVVPLTSACSTCQREKV